MSLSGAGATHSYFIPETTWGSLNKTLNAAAILSSVARIRNRPGALPSETTSRVSSRVMGNHIARGITHRTRSTLAGSFSFNLDSHVNNSNLIHELAGIGQTLTEDKYSALSSHSIYVPLVENPNYHSGKAIEGILYKGMKVNQYTLNLAGENSLLDCTLGFIGRNVEDIGVDWTNTTVPGAGTDELFLFNISAGSAGHVTKNSGNGIGTPFEAWTAAIKFNTVFLRSINSFSINIANGLTPVNFATSGDYIGEPVVTGRTVTGSFTIPYSSATGLGSYQNFIEDLQGDNSTFYDVEITIFSSRDSDRKVVITMPEMEIMQGQTVNSLNTGYMPVSFSFQAFGSPGTSANNEIYIVNT